MISFEVSLSDTQPLQWWSDLGRPRFDNVPIMDIAKMNRQRAAQALHLAEMTLSAGRRSLYLSLASEWLGIATERETAFATREAVR